MTDLIAAPGSLLEAGRALSRPTFDIGIWWVEDDDDSPADAIIAHSTADGLATWLAIETLHPVLANINDLSELLALRICDPACGAGSFLLPAADLIEKRAAELTDPMTPPPSRSVAASAL